MDNKKKKILFIYNPYAGKGRIRLYLSSIIEFYVKHGYEVIIYSTQEEKDATRIVKECLVRDDYDFVISSGGDGTLNEVISGMIQLNKKVNIGFIPSGTTNDFAYSLGLPKNILEAAETVLKGEPFPCDIGKLNGKFFAYAAAFGIFTDTSYATPQTTKNILGRLAYILEGIKSIPKWKSHHVKILSGDRLIEDEFIYGMIANSSSVGGFKGITGKDVMLDDGVFEGVFIKVPHSVLELQTIINDLMHGNTESEHIIYLPVKKLELLSGRSIKWTIDGEYGGKYKRVQIENLKQATTIIRGR